MFALLRSAIVAALLLLSLQLPVLCEDAKSPATDPGLAAADKFYRAGKFADAEASYNALLRTDSKLVPAQVGLVRAMLGQQKIDESLDRVNTALAAQPNSAALLAAKGDVQFRRGEMSDAEMSYLAAQKLDPKEVRAHLGLALLYRSFSLYRRAYVHIQIAHKIAPDDFMVQVAWLYTLPQKQRLAALESYLNSPHPDQEEEGKSLTTYLESLKATMGESSHSCRLVSKVEKTEAKLETVYGVNAAKIRDIVGIDLATKVNDQNSLLRLDTGASGIVVNRTLAEKAGLARISAAYSRGIGDQGMRAGYRALAKQIRVGDLEFQDCVVLVTDPPRGLDGFIGTDVFGSYLVDLDLPGMRLKLSPLPKRPDDAVTPTSLNSEPDKDVDGERGDYSTSAQTTTEQNTSAPSPKSEQLAPRDRYIAPEMVNWTQVFRFGHILLVPTNVNDSKPLLFILDTGSPDNLLSVRAGRQVSKVRSDDRVRISGMSGNVKEVYSSKATLRFGHFEQKNNDIFTLDLAAENRRNGTEVSGFLGFQVLKLLEVKLDYRDGLVDFEYAPKRPK